MFATSRCSTNVSTGAFSGSRAARIKAVPPWSTAYGGRMFKYFKGSFVFAAICLAIGAWIGWTLTHDIAGTVGIVWIVLVLGVLEVSLSFDNAVVNATVLRDMTPVWQRRFLTWGIIIAVFGMRILFPLVIVAIAARLGPIDAVVLAATDPVA